MLSDIGKEVVELSRICDFMKTRKKNYFYLRDKSSYAMSECDITSELNGMGKLINTRELKLQMPQKRCVL